MEQFEIGDSALLKSGGPSMTVVEVGVGKDELVACRWYDGKKFLIDWFPPQTLKLEDSDGGIGIA